MKVVKSETVIPHDLDAERCVLGAILVDNERFFDVADVVAAGDFFRVAHRQIFTAMHALASGGKAIDFRTLAAFLRDDGQLDEVGGVAYLAALTDGMPRSSNAVAYAEIVARYALRARVVVSTERILREAHETSSDGSNLLAFAMEQIFDLQASSLHKGDFVAPGQLVADGMIAINEIQDGTRAPGIRTGWVDLDEKLLGMKPGNLILVAARPAMGKTAFALNLADKVSRVDQLPVGFLSLEMSQEELTTRLVASVGRIDAARLMAREGLGHSELSHLGEAFCRIGDSKLYVDDTAEVGVFDVRSKARRLKARHGLSLLIVDYLQLMKMPKAENRNNEVAAASRALKLMAKELQVPVVVLSQLNRASERRGDDHRPQLSDLRDSGALEQDADVVLFIHRPEYYKPDDAELHGLAEVIIAKQRNGPTGSARMCWLKQYQRFADLA